MAWSVATAQSLAWARAPEAAASPAMTQQASSALARAERLIR
ncbi:MAG TPA: hypothetical protein VLK61_28310 [Aquabacterium sp.]|nr:hypothetical protein [Aquabacterium sp.]